VAVPSAPGGSYPATVTPPTRSGPSPSRPPPTSARPGTRLWPPSVPTDGPDGRGLSDGKLLHLRDTYPIETAWAPQYVGDELCQVRTATEARAPPPTPNSATATRTSTTRRSALQNQTPPPTSSAPISPSPRSSGRPR
jgi:hypothetical protein